MNNSKNITEYEEDRPFKSDSFVLPTCISVPHVDNFGKKLILESSQINVCGRRNDGSQSKLGRAVSQPLDPEEYLHDSLDIGDVEDESFTSSLKRRAQGRKRHNRSLYGVSPDCKFGPKGYLAQGSTNL
ncbi:NAD kinase-like isoform X2 [Biomphalaria pfeifferi]|uniref:NAD kinase-like isoform X2 n=1 Tax=Biomphalaria pfeifferi TaxID=112525 RepID=A0AAD8BMK7_BIOPF|nr:NAD kinase-like isoform X2 [Biomphalaria pfeifferi]